MNLQQYERLKAMDVGDMEILEKAGVVSEHDLHEAIDYAKAVANGLLPFPANMEHLMFEPRNVIIREIVNFCVA